MLWDRFLGPFLPGPGLFAHGTWGKDQTPPLLCVQGFLSVFSLAGTLYHLCVIWTCGIGHRTGNEVFIFIISPRLKGVFSNWIVSANASVCFQ